MFPNEPFSVSGYILTRRVVKYMRDSASVNISRFLKSFDADIKTYKRTHSYNQVPTYNTLYVVFVRFTVKKSKQEYLRHFENALLEFAIYSELEVYFDNPVCDSIPLVSSRDSHLLRKEELSQALTLADLQYLID